MISCKTRSILGDFACHHPFDSSTGLPRSPDLRCRSQKRLRAFVRNSIFKIQRRKFNNEKSTLKIQRRKITVENSTLEIQLICIDTLRHDFEHDRALLDKGYHAESLLAEAEGLEAQRDAVLRKLFRTAELGGKAALHKAPREFWVGRSQNVR